MSKEEKIILYTLDEESMYNYFLKIELDRKIISDFLFKEESSITRNNRSAMCEYFTLLDGLENVLEEILDDDCKDETTDSYITTTQQAARISIYMEGIVHAKQILNSQNISLYLH